MAKSNKVKTQKTAAQDEEITLRKIIGSIMTNNVTLTKEEYNEMLKRVGANFEGEDKATDRERLERIQSNFYGTIVNMLFTLLRQNNALQEEIEVWRSLLKALCDKNGIDTSKLKTSTDIINEAAAKYIQQRTKKVEDKK